MLKETWDAYEMILNQLSVLQRQQYGRPKQVTK
jgi:hypothetical protein